MSASHLQANASSRWVQRQALATAIASTAIARQRAHYRNMTLWTFQGWLAMFFIAAGYAKLTEPIDLLTILLGWPNAGMSALLHQIGAVEVALGVAMISPVISWKAGRLPLLVASLGIFSLAVVMSVVHGARGEFGFALLNLLLACLSGAVGVGRIQRTHRRRWG